MDHQPSSFPELPGGDATVTGAARELARTARAAREEGEALRHVPAAMADSLARAGLLQMYFPRAMGGPELPPLTAFRAVEEVSRGDGSIGWCTMIASAISSFIAWLEPDVGREMAGSPADMRIAGSTRPQGRARRVEGGYRIDGRWDFASGIHHARWLMCPCVVMDGDKPRRNAAGGPIVQICWVAAGEAAILDTWHVLGLRGTGSHDFAVSDVFVPDARSALLGDPPRQKGLLYQPRLHLTCIWTATAGNALGIARSALEDFAELASTRASTMSTSLLRDRPLVQMRLAEAEAMVGAARAYLLSAVGELWARAERGETDLDATVARARLSITHAMHEAVRAVDVLFHAAGTNAVYEKNPLERHFRNIHVAVQHAAGLPGHLESAGKVLLGLRPADPGW